MRRSGATRAENVELKNYFNASTYLHEPWKKEE
jgi:hypothetical protein